MLIAGDCEAEVNKLKENMCKSFHMKDLGEPRYFLGIMVDRTSEGIHLNQRKYALELLEEARMKQAKPIATPLDP